MEFKVSNGIYTSPECMKGEPVAKIGEGDAYWVDSWTRLGDWYPNVDNNADREESVTYFSTFQIHPNQLISKKYYDAVGLCLRKYPIILRRIFQVVEYGEISDPLQWLRNRLAYLIQGYQKDEDFSLKRILQDFQKNDLTYQKYYKEHRYKSIDYKSIRNKSSTLILLTLAPGFSCFASNLTVV